MEPIEESTPEWELILCSILFGLIILISFFTIPMIIIRRTHPCLAVRSPWIRAFGQAVGYFVLPIDLAVMFLGKNETTCRLISYVFSLVAPLWLFPHLLYIPSVVFQSELNELKIQRQQAKPGEQNWRWNFRYVVGDRFQFTMIAIFSIIAAVIAVLVDFFIPPLPADPCIYRSVVIFTVLSSSLVIALLYFLFKILFVQDPYYVRFEVIANSFVYIPIFIFLIVYSISPTLFPPNFDIRIILIFVAFFGQPINGIFPVLLSFDIPQRMFSSDRGKVSSDLELFSHYLRKSGDESLDFDELKAVLDDPDFLDAFTNFTIKLWCVENVIFYKAVQDFEDNFGKEDYNIKQKAGWICSEFIENNSPLEVNLEIGTKKEVLSKAENENFDQSMFSAAKKHFFNLMKKDSFRKWTNSQDFHEFSKQISLQSKPANNSNRKLSSASDYRLH